MTASELAIALQALRAINHGTGAASLIEHNRQAAIALRNHLLRETGLPPRPLARQLNAYRAGDWRRQHKDLISNPHAEGTTARVFWQVLKLADRDITSRHLKNIL
jgi:hypothetical protein